MNFSHDIAAGSLDYCQVCFGTELELVIDLGHQPLCDSLLSPAQLAEPEISYPLRLFRCKRCTGTQLDYVVPGEIVYHKGYPYKAGITREVVEHHQDSSRRLTRELGLDESALVVDIGSNDGTLLAGFKKHGVRTLGVEPTDVAKLAQANGIETVQAPFTESLAREIAATHGKASLLTATNVFAHMGPVGEVLRGAEALLKDDGHFMTETHYLVDVLRGVQYDTIYHEHIRTYSLKALVTLFEQYDFTVVEAERVERYAGTLRVLAARGKKRKAGSSVTTLLQAERDFGLFDSRVYTEFRERSFRAKDELLSLCLRAKAEGARLVGNSCPGRCSTLLNFTGIGPDQMPYIAEQPTSLKLGLYLPGKHIPIVENSVLIEEQPDYVVLLAWHYGAQIGKLLRERGLRSRLVMPLPHVHELKI